MSLYISILSDSSKPIDVGWDANNRLLRSMNFTIKAQSVVTDLEGEILKRLNDVSLATFSTNPTTGDTFIGSRVTIPTGEGPFIQIIDTGGSRAERSHGRKTNKIENLSLQVFVRGLDFDTTTNRARLILDELDGINNAVLVA